MTFFEVKKQLEMSHGFLYFFWGSVVEGPQRVGCFMRVSFLFVEIRFWEPTAGSTCAMVFCLQTQQKLCLFFWLGTKSTDDNSLHIDFFLIFFFTVREGFLKRFGGGCGRTK